ncbi:MAG: bifunctional folylpolyglutamate synthase/dihydrofolate synthase [Hydrotalea flava]|uniref:bifunctional folylpolyglutamate synthase/dihydrofolate synthase n=1 Tax=Hydrotalea sp. AMD TaxID=2501297 RepID=UPI0009433456|nr:folylpolyglutamate synthase/dihydrofolate synthase family protein [Hydrotalea sp. AMD]MBY0346995.1 bifunctional folylpolyglutamate synthase/dihydrofolate synthase [Hydrotalea flava]RWZ89757.1 MAG: bifunctional folylpolyglutamate synthase/dihydrofolate synthase [Hydrotalea sp. AMD]
MNYRETIAYLYEQLPMFSKQGESAYKKDLTNTLLLCEKLRNPQQHFKTIHIAGTNGKGSTSHMLAAILQTAGYKTGLYTSPHLKDFRERIKVNGNLCSEEFIVSFTEQMIPAIQSIQPSFFEITVAMAFDYFSKQQVDIAVIETGLGGRLDSTNIILPELSVITNIGWDHMNLLGNTLEAIASEKAGIIKKNIPVVIGEVIPETKSVFENSAKQNSAPIIFAQEQFSLFKYQQTLETLTVTVKNNNSGLHETYTLDLPGLYQTNNLITVLTSIQQLNKNGWNLQESVVQKALAHTKKVTGLHGRWELLQQQPNVIADVAHNEAGIQQLLQQIAISQYRHLHLVFGMVKDKDADTVLKLLPKQASYYFTQAHIPRALAADILLEKASIFGLKGKTYSQVNEAVRAAIQQAGKNDLIVVCGSVFLIAEIDKEKFISL